MLVYDYSEGEGTWLGVLFSLLGTAPAAPVFLLLMGVFLWRSRVSLAVSVVRGVRLILLGYLLNFLRFSLPVYLFSSADLLPGDSSLDYFFEVDILHLAGLSLIFGAVCKKFLSRKLILLLALVIVFVAPFLWQSEPILSPLLLFWGDSTHTHFPFFPWFFYPLVGMAISGVATDPDLLRRLHKKISALAAVTVAVGLSLLPFFPIVSYVRGGPALHFLILGFVFFWLLGFFALAKTRFAGSFFARILTFWSSHVTTIYFLQWILFGWGILIFGFASQPDYIAAAIGCGVLFLTDRLVRLSWIQKIFAKI